MKRNLISFATAKLAKEKGFNEACFYYYNASGEKNDCFLENGSSTDVEFRVDLEDLEGYHNQQSLNYYSAPVQAELQRWLREKHSIAIWLLPDISYPSSHKWECQYALFNTTHTQGNRFSLDELYGTYEESLERGLLEALTLIN